MLDDQPSNNDLLGRRPFAESIARIIASQSDSAPLVIAIDGAWGEGKTTVFGFLETALENEGVLIMNFNPWRHPNEETMARAFLLDLAGKAGIDVKKKGEKQVETVTRRFGWLGRILELIPGGGKTASAIGQVTIDAFRSSIDDIRNKLRAKLKDIGKRVVILIDDPDRLDVEQLFGLFRLIKLTADFERTTFVLAMDCSAVSKTVGQRFGGSGQERDDEGRRFLEKIIQVPLRLPAVPHVKIRDFTLGLVQNVVSDLKIDLSESEVQRFRGAFDPALMPLIITPRLAKQYTNALRFALGFSIGEINVVDVMLLEGLRLLIPELFERLIKQVAPVIDTALDQDITSNRDDLTEKAMTNVLASVSGQASPRAIRFLLGGLFPNTFDRMEYSQESYLRWAAEKRVACEDYLWRYLHCAIPEHDVADADLEQLLCFAEDGDLIASTKMVHDMFAPKMLQVAVRKLRWRESQISHSQRQTLARAIASNSDLLTKPESAMSFEAPFGQGAIAVAHFIRDFDPGDERERLAAEILANAKSVVWADELFSWLPHDEKESQGRNSGEKRYQAFSLDVSERLGAVLAKRLMDEYERLGCNSTIELLRHCNYCQKWGQRDRFRTWVKHQLLNWPEFLEPLICSFLTWSYGGRGREFGWPGDSHVRDAMLGMVDVDWLLARFDPEEPKKRDDWSDRITPQEAVYQVIQLLKKSIDSVNSKPPIGGDQNDLE